MYNKILSLTDDSYYPFVKESIITHSVRLSSHVTCTATEPNLYFVNFLWLCSFTMNCKKTLTFQHPNLMSIFHCLGHTKGSRLVYDPLYHFITWIFLSWGAQPPPGGPPHCGCLLHPHPEDVPCHGDRTHMTWT